MESSSSNSEERELQRMQREERELHQKCLTWFKKLKIHLGNLHKFFEVRNTRPLEIAYRILFREEHQTFREKMCHNLNQLQWQLKRDNFQGHDSKTFLDVLRTQFKEFFNSKDVNALDFHNKSWKKYFKDYTIYEPKTYRRNLLRSESLFGHEGIEMDDNSIVKESTDDSVTSSKQLDESSSSWNNADADIGPSYNSDTVSEVHHDMFENVFAHGIQNHEQPESIPDIYMVNENKNNIIFDIPNMDLDRGKEEQDDVDYEQQRAFFASLNKNLKCDVKNTDQTLRMLLPKEDNVQSGKQGLGFENKIDVENPCLLNKAKELALLKQRKYPLSYHGFVYGETQFEEPPKVPLKRRNANLKKHLKQTETLEQAQLNDSDPSNVESELVEKRIIFGNETSSFETKIKELKMTLDQQTKDFEDAKVDFSKKMDKFETYFEKLKKTRVVLKQQLDRKIQDSKAEKD
ncbi:hypothetical protein Tco_1430148 [Tanacetum coccineum]